MKPIAFVSVRRFVAYIYRIANVASAYLRQYDSHHASIKPLISLYLGIRYFEIIIFIVSLCSKYSAKKTTQGRFKTSFLYYFNNIQKYNAS